MSSIPALFVQCVQRNPQALFASVFQIEERGWRTYSNQEVLEASAGFSQRLFSLGVTKGTRVAIWSSTRIEWCMIDIAILGLGGVVIGLNRELNPAIVIELLEKHQVEVLIVEQAQQYLDLEERLDELEDLVHFLSIVPSDEMLPLTAAQTDQEWFLRQVQQVQETWPATTILQRGKGGKRHLEFLSHRAGLIQLQHHDRHSDLHQQDDILLDSGYFHSIDRLFIELCSEQRGRCYFFSPPTDLHYVLLECNPTVLMTEGEGFQALQLMLLQQFTKHCRDRDILVRWVLLVLTVLEQKNKKGKILSWRLRCQERLVKRLVLSSLNNIVGDNLRSIIVNPLKMDGLISSLWSAGDIVVIDGDQFN